MIISDRSDSRPIVGFVSEKAEKEFNESGVVTFDNVDYSLVEMQEAYESGEYWPLALGYVIERTVTQKAFALYSGDLSWYVCTKKDEAIEVVHQTMLSDILTFGRSCEDYGYTSVEQCWNFEYLFDENDFV